MRSARTYTVVTTVDVAISSQGTNKPRNASVSLFVDLYVYFYAFSSGLSSGNWTAEGTERTAKRLRVTNMTGLLLASFFLDIQLTIHVLVISKNICFKGRRALAELSRLQCLLSSFLRQYWRGTVVYKYLKSTFWSPARMHLSFSSIDDPWAGTGKRQHGCALETMGGWKKRRFLSSHRPLRAGYSFFFDFILLLLSMESLSRGISSLFCVP